MRRSGILLALLVLPLTVPVLIFGAGAIDAAGAGLPATVPLLLLGAGLAVSGPLAPLVCATALRIGSQ
jgi:heme exporter protein B